MTVEAREQSDEEAKEGGWLLGFVKVKGLEKGWLPKYCAPPL